MEEVDADTRNSLVAMRQQTQSLNAQITDLQSLLNNMLTQMTNLATPVRDALQKLPKIQADLLEYEPTTLATVGGLGVKILYGAATAGISFAAGHKEMINIAHGTATDGVKAASYTMSGLGVGLAITAGVWEFAKGRIEVDV